MGNFSGKKKKLVVGGLASILLVAMVVAVTVTITNKKGSDATAAPAVGNGGSTISTTAKAVKAICSPTDYKETCEQSLSNANSTDPKELIKVVFEVAVKNISDVIKKSSLLKEAAADPMTKAALETCEELLDTSIDDLKRSFEKVDAFDITKMDEYIEDLKTWLSAAITYQETCIDGFENTTGDMAEKMKKLLKTATELSSNGLAMVSDFSTVLSSLQIEGFGRKLLSEEDPTDYDQLPAFTLDKASQKRKLMGTGDEESVKRRLNDYGYDPDNDNNIYHFAVLPLGGYFNHKASQKRTLLGHDSEESERRRLNDYGHDPSDYDINDPSNQHGHPFSGKASQKRTLLGHDSEESERRRLNDYGHDPSDYDINDPSNQHGHPFSGKASQKRTLLGHDSEESERRRLNDYGHDPSDYDINDPSNQHGHPFSGKASQKRTLLGHDSEESERRRLNDYGHDPSDYDINDPSNQHGHPFSGKASQKRILLDHEESDRRILNDYGHDPTDYDPNDPRNWEGRFTNPNFVNSKARRLLGVPRAFLRPNVVVAQDGSGRFRRINDAIATVPKKNNSPFIIFVKAGRYKETVIIPRKMNNVILIGEGPTRTIITGNKNFAEGTQTFHSATVAVNGDDFIARDIGIENTAGPQKHQAVALRVSGDRAIFQNVHMNGFQDTLYAHAYRQYYRDCLISGTIDFVFGDAVSIFQHCRFVVRKPMNNQACMVTAQGRKDPRGVGVIVIQDSDIIAEREFAAVKPALRAYLGRPWKEYSRTIIMRSYIDGFIDPEGWSPWAGTYALDTLYYGEYQNRGAGSNLSRRVRWNGIKKITPNIAQSFTGGRLYQGDHWITSSGVPYVPGL